MQSNNIALKNAFGDPVSLRKETTNNDLMTVQGTANKTGVLLLLCMLTAAISWNMPALAFPFMIVGGLSGLVIAIALAFKPQWAMFGGPVYALLQGLSMGAISAIFNAAYPGIVFQAVGISFGVLAVMLVAYTSGLVRATEKFKMGVIVATGGIMLFYIGSMIMGFLGFQNPAMQSGLIGIAFSLFVVVIAALNLVLDFAMIEESADRGAPQYMEWYGAFALMVTLVWLYLEILRLLSKLRSRD
jgi:uncharacterized YccA/Bax inhibitor family protein